MIKFQIPEKLLPAFRAIIQFSIEEIENLKLLLQGFTVGSHPRELEKELSNKPFINNSTLMAQTLFSFGELLFKNEGDFNSLAKELTNAYIYGNENPISETEKEQLITNLQHLFESGENLKQTFKAYQLLSENNHIFNQSRILTDIRTLFDETTDKAPNDALIIHRLKIEYLHNNRPKEIFLSLDANDLLELEEQIQRAKKKESLLKQTFSNLNFIEIKE